MITAPVSGSAAVIGASAAVRQLVAAEIRSGNPLEAERLLREFLARNPLDVPVLALLGDVLRTQGRLNDSLACLRRASAAAPGDGAARHMLARLLDEQGEVEAALKQVESIGSPLRDDPAVRSFEAALLGKL